jgi:hypothetical protein
MKITGHQLFVGASKPKISTQSVGNSLWVDSPKIEHIGPAGRQWYKKIQH